MMKQKQLKQQKKSKFSKIFSRKNLANPFSSQTRQLIIVVFIYLLFIAIILKLAHLQIIQYSEKYETVHNTVYKEKIEEQKRGSILDRNGKTLSTSIKKYTVYLDAKMITDLSAIEKLLAKHNIFLNDKDRKAIENKKRYIPIEENISEYTILQINKEISEELKKENDKERQTKKEIKKNKRDKEKKEFYLNELKKINKNKFAGLAMRSTYKRVYPEKNLAAHVIGKVNSENIGTYGIEKFCNEQLIGEDIKRQLYTIGNKKIFSDSLSEKQIEQSNNITLTIDRKLQFIVEEELENGLKKTKSKKGIAIIQNPHNGEILAMASFPNYNPAEKVSKLEYLKNNAISNSAEPGSTFKIVVLAAVLEEGLFKLADKINCENGKFNVYGQIISDHDKQKIITVQQVIERSSNIGTAKLALKLGEEKFYQYIKLFGFNSLTGIELTGEEKGILKTTDNWSKRSLHTLSFGQELFVTPLQTINAYSAIANGGVLLKPKIIKSIGNTDYTKVEEVRRVVSEDTAYKVRQALVGVVTDGTGKSAQVKGYSVGGKTGTAQKFDPTLKKYSKKHYMTSFCGIIPAMNPELVILVIYDEPEGEYYASSVTAPVFSKIAQRAVEYLKIKPDIVEIKKIIKGAKK